MQFHRISESVDGIRSAGIFPIVPRFLPNNPTSKAVESESLLGSEQFHEQESSSNNRSQPSILGHGEERSNFDVSESDFVPTDSAFTTLLDAGDHYPNSTSFGTTGTSNSGLLRDSVRRSDKSNVPNSLLTDSSSIDVEGHNGFLPGSTLTNKSCNTNTNSTQFTFLSNSYKEACATLESIRSDLNSLEFSDRGNKMYRSEITTLDFPSKSHQAYCGDNQMVFLSPAARDSIHVLEDVQSGPPHHSIGDLSTDSSQVSLLFFSVCCF